MSQQNELGVIGTIENNQLNPLKVLSYQNV